MRSVSVRLDDLKNTVLNLGYVGENEHTQVRIDCKKMYDQYPAASASLTVSPPSGAAYPAVIERDGDLVIWDITDSDLINEGAGEIQLSFTTGEIVAKTYIGRFKVSRSIVPTGEIPEGIDDFLTRAGAALTAIPETINEALAEAKASGEFDGPAGPAGQDGTDGQDGYSPTATVTKSGKVATITITDKNGTTTAQISDGEGGGTSDYSDLTNKPQIAGVTLTGNKSLSDLGADPTSIIDDTAGDGNTNKTWSADKLAAVKSDIQQIESTEHGKNLFNGEWTEGYFINTANGTLAENSAYKYADYIEVEAEKTYTISAYLNTSYAVTGLMYAFYKADKTFISGASATATFTTPSNTKYIRFSLNKLLTNGQLEEGSVRTDYEAYTLKTILAPDMVMSNKVKHEINEMIDEKPLNVSPQDTTFFKPSPNLFDPSTEVENELVNQSNGAFSSSTGSNRSGYIEVKPNTPYSFINQGGGTNQYIRYAFYKSDKTFISGAYGLLKDIGFVVSPSNAKYIAISFPSVNRPFMVAESDTIPAFYPYSYTCIDPQYVVAELPNDIIINLPTKVYATEGIELNIYFENLTEDWTKYKWNVDCSVGQQTARGFSITPTSSQAGTYDLSITAKAQDGTAKRVNASLIVTASSAGSSASASVLILGDSTTANGTAVSKLNANFADDPMTVTTVGTLGTSPNNHEGRSGWTFDQYFNESSGNAFYHGGTFDATYYFQNSGVSSPDWFFINLGINDMFNYTTDETLMNAIATAIGYCNSMISNIRTANANIKIGVCLTIPPNHSQDAFGKAYNCNQSRDRYKRNNAIWVRKLIETYDRRENSNIFIVPIHTALDTVYNMGMETLPVNARNTSVTYESPIDNGGVHPVESGYWQIADVYTAFLKAQTNT